MRIAASFITCREQCDSESCACPYIRVSVEASATWDPEMDEPEFFNFEVMGWDAEGHAPKWSDLTRRESQFGLDALYTACPDKEVRAEWEAKQPSPRLSPNTVSA